MKDRILELRKALRMTQGAFGEKLGITGSGVSNIENGIREIQERHIKLILSAFPQVSEKWLRTGEGIMFVEAHDAGLIAEIVKKYSFDQMVYKLLEVYDTLHDDQKEAVLDYAQKYITALVGAAGAADPVPAEPDPPQRDEIDVDAEVEAYRQQLLQEKKIRESSLLSDGAAG